VIDHVVEAIVAVHQHGLVVLRQVGGQPFEQLVHRLDGLGFRRLVLLAPARDLARDVAARPAEVGQAEADIVDGMQAGEHVELGPVDRQPAFLGNLGQQRVPQHPAVAIFHDVESGADDAVVLAQRVGPGGRHIGLIQRRNHAEFPIDRMGRRQQLARRLAAQHVAAPGAIGQAIGRVRLATLELLGRDRRHEAATSAAMKRASRCSSNRCFSCTGIVPTYSAPRLATRLPLPERSFTSASTFARPFAPMQ
jgi:hypothetical protein